MKDITDTICALATPAGRSGIAVVRLSGPNAFAILEGIFTPSIKVANSVPGTAVLGKILNPQNNCEIDEAMVTRFRSPRSYTGEDMGEISLHGNLVLVAALIESICSLGARLAEPGEFTMRAFLHGKIDLAQAEAVRDVIDSTTLYQAQVAGRQRAGIVGQGIRPVKEQLVNILVQLESAIEFGEEDIELQGRVEIDRKLEGIRETLMNWIESFRRGRLIREGISLAIVGGPNVGKSSLFNALLAQQRAIVTDIPGTTRDLISESLNMNGIPVRLQDTAGIRESVNPVEQIGIERSRQAMVDSDALIVVGDVSRPLSRKDLEIGEQLDGLRYIVVLNKCDLETKWTETDKRAFGGYGKSIEVSCKSGLGIQALRDLVFEEIMGPKGIESDGMMITNIRHCRALEAARAEIGHAVLALREGLSEEFALSNLHRALGHLGEITGETGVEDLLGAIFSQFCIGK